MNILFITFHGFDPNNGISKKIMYQIKALKSLGNNVHLCYLDETDAKRRMIDNDIIAEYGDGFLSKIRKKPKCI